MAFNLTIAVTAEPPKLVPASPFRAEVFVTDESGETVLDRRGERALVWPECLMELPPFQRREFATNVLRGLATLLAVRAREKRDADRLSASLAASPPTGVPPEEVAPPTGVAPVV